MLGGATLPHAADEAPTPEQHDKRTKGAAHARFIFNSPPSPASAKTTGIQVADAINAAKGLAGRVDRHAMIMAQEEFRE